MKLVDMQGLKPCPFWVLVQVQVQVITCVPLPPVLLYSPQSYIIFTVGFLYYLISLYVRRL